MRVAVVIVVLLVLGERGGDGWTGEPGEQGVDDGAVGPVRRRVRGGAEVARLYDVVDRQRAAAGRAAQRLVGGARAVGRGVERRAGRGVLGLAAGRWAPSLPVVASRSGVPAGCAARARGADGRAA